MYAHDGEMNHLEAAGGVRSRGAHEQCSNLLVMSGSQKW